jgi:excinuclease ABC subunit A
LKKGFWTPQNFLLAGAFLSVVVRVCPWLKIKVLSVEKIISVRGVKTHNLKNIDVDIPRGMITALVGVCGAGKTSLAFDTIYAEGYLRYIESISPYIRQFLDKIEKPAVEKIEGLPPAISFKQKKPAKNPRSIVATSLDVYDYLRLLYSKAAVFHCPGCGKHVKQYSIDEIIPEILETYEGKIDVCFKYKGDVAFLINRGYYFYIDEQEKNRTRIDHQVKDKTIYVLIDSVEIDPANKSRLFEALDRSISFGGGTAFIFYREKGNGKKHLRLFPSSLYCSTCGIEYPEPDEHLFSFNSPKGACETCKGFGDLQTVDKELIFDPSKSLAEGAALPFNSPATRHYGEEIIENAQLKGIDINQPSGALNDEEIEFLMDGGGYFGGIRGFFDWLKTKSYKVQARVFVSRYTTYRPCDACGGSRLNPVARAFTIQNKNIGDFLSLTIQEAVDLMHSLEPGSLENKIAPEVLTDMQTRLDFLVQTGLSYIQLNRPTFTLSRGEFQRINLAFILGSTLTGSLLILDQPSSDLHPHDYEKLESFLTRLKENDNTLLLIEHNRDIAAACDGIVELGPGSGEEGGEVVFTGSAKTFFSPGSSNPTLSQHYFNRPYSFNPAPASPNGWLSFKKADSHNLKGFDFKIPKHAFTVIAGVSGAGKTTLLYHEMYLKPRERLRQGKGRKQVKETVFIDPGLQRIRSNTIVAGFFDVFTVIRERFARLKESRIHRYTPGHFSFNSPQGRCGHCKGKGFNEIEMQFLPAVNVPCHACGATGYKPDILKIRFKGRNIRETLDLGIDEFIDFAGEELAAAKQRMLLDLRDNGLGHIRLGQPLKTLSAGELQRLKLLKHLNLKTSHTLFLIDEPSFGMHPHDIGMIKNLIDGLTANKNTVVAAEHNMELLTHAGYLVELGPGGGDKGGYVVYTGKTGDILDAPGSLTGMYLKKKFRKYLTNKNIPYK